MKYFLLLIAFGASLAFGVTNNMVWRIPTTSGLPPQWGAINLADNTNAVTGLLPRANLAHTNIQTSASSGFYTVTTSYADVTNLSVGLTTTGGNVSLCIQAASAANAGAFSVTSGGSGNPQTVLAIKFVRASTDIFVYRMASLFLNSSNVVFPGYVCATDSPSAGTYTYKVQATMSGSGAAASIEYVVLKAYEQ